MDRGAWQASVHGITKNWTSLSMHTGKELRPHKLQSTTPYWLDTSHSQLRTRGYTRGQVPGCEAHPVSSSNSEYHAQSHLLNTIFLITSTTTPYMRGGCVDQGNIKTNLICNQFIVSFNNSEFTTSIH